MFSHICDMAVCELQLCPHAGPRAKGTRVWNFQGLGHVGQLFRCLIGVITREMDLETLNYLRFQLLGTLTKPRDMFSRSTHIHTLLHVDILKILHRSEMLSKLLSYWNVLHLYSQSSHLFMEGEAHTPNPGSHGLPRGCAIWPPYMDMYFQIRAENPESDLGREPKKP